MADIEFPARQIPETNNARNVTVELGEPICTSVSDLITSHVWNTTGQPLDVARESLTITERRPIHRTAPSFDQIEARTEILETGIKIGLFGGTGVGMTVLVREMIRRGGEPYPRGQPVAPDVRGGVVSPAGRASSSRCRIRSPRWARAGRRAGADRKVWSGPAGIVISRTLDGELGILRGPVPVKRAETRLTAAGRAA